MSLSRLHYVDECVEIFEGINIYLNKRNALLSGLIYLCTIVYTDMIEFTNDYT